MSNGYYACSKYDINCDTSICIPCFLNEKSTKGGKPPSEKNDKTSKSKETMRHNEDFEVDDEFKGLYCHEGFDLVFANKPRERSPYYGETFAHC